MSVSKGLLSVIVAGKASKPPYRNLCFLGAAAALQPARLRDTRADCARAEGKRAPAHVTRIAGQALKETSLASPMVAAGTAQYAGCK